jgi:hypothetical protein
MTAKNVPDPFQFSLGDDARYQLHHQSIYAGKSLSLRPYRLITAPISAPLAVRRARWPVGATHSELNIRARHQSITSPGP